MLFGLVRTSDSVVHVSVFETHPVADSRSAVVFVRAVDAETARAHVRDLLSRRVRDVEELGDVAVEVRSPDEPALARAVAAASGHGRLMTSKILGPSRPHHPLWQQPGEWPPGHEGEHT